MTGPLGDPVPAAVLLVGTTAYVESAQACGLHLVPQAQRDPARHDDVRRGRAARGRRRRRCAPDRRRARRLGHQRRRGRAARRPGRHRDGRGRQRRDRRAPPRRSGAARRRDGRCDRSPCARRRGRARRRHRRRQPAARSARRDERVRAAEGRRRGRGHACSRDRWRRSPLRSADATTARTRPWRSGRVRPAGSGTRCCTSAPSACRASRPCSRPSASTSGSRPADVVVTGEGSFDWQSLRGKVVAGVAGAALAQGRGCVVLAGRVEVGRREFAATGVSAAYSVVDLRRRAPRRPWPSRPRASPTWPSAPRAPGADAPRSDAQHAGKAALAPAWHHGARQHAQRCAGPSVGAGNTLPQPPCCHRREAISTAPQHGRTPRMTADVTTETATPVTDGIQLTETASSKVAALLDAGGSRRPRRCASPSSPAAARACATSSSSTTARSTATSSRSSARSRSSPTA